MQKRLNGRNKMVEKTQHYNNLDERNDLIAMYKDVGYRLLHDDFGADLHGILTFTNKSTFQNQGGRIRRIVILVALMLGLCPAFIGTIVFYCLANGRIIVPDSFNLAEFYLSVGIFILVLVALILHIREAVKW